ncbi:hypothetical protein F5B20DRAFT_36299 [Whalleya microplaca]|nr:hypothetical protein F5B20DRAFT_36299 [Whalleya microplaca]
MADVHGESIIMTLPTELKQEILKELDLDSLHSMILSCRGFYDAFIAADRLISFAITVKSMPPDLLSIALARYAATQADWNQSAIPTPQDKLPGNVKEFAGRYLVRTPNPRLIAPSTFNIKAASEMLSLHHIISKLAGIYLEHQIHSHNDESPFLYRKTVWQASGPEIGRVQKALYITEILRELLPSLDPDVDSIPTDNFLTAPFNQFWEFFSPWENQLVASVTASLFQVVHGKNFDLKPLGLTHMYPMTTHAPRPHMYELFFELGLRGVGRLLLKQDDDNSTAETVFLASKQRRKHYGNRVACTNIGLEWLLPLPADTKHLSLDINHLLEKYPEEDTGPRDFWYCSLIITIRQLRGPFWARPQTSFESPGSLLPWADRARLDQSLKSRLPSIEEMAQEVAGFYGHRQEGSLQRHHWVELRNRH